MVRVWICVALLGMAGTANAEENSRAYLGRGWSVLSGETVGNGNNVFLAQVGWPGLVASVLHGATSHFDLGGRLTFNYGQEGIVTRVVPGLKLQALFRWKLLDTGRVKLGLAFSPGPLFYFGAGSCDRYGCYYRPGSEVGLALPLDLMFGIPLGSAVMMSFGFSMPLWLTFGDAAGAVVPLLFGGGVEYFVDSRLSLNFKLSMGPAVDTRRAYVGYALDALFGVAVRF